MQFQIIYCRWVIRNDVAYWDSRLISVYKSAICLPCHRPDATPRGLAYLREVPLD